MQSSRISSKKFRASSIQDTASIYGRQPSAFKASSRKRTAICKPKLASKKSKSKIRRPKRVNSAEKSQSNLGSTLQLPSEARGRNLFNMGNLQSFVGSSQVSSIGRAGRRKSPKPAVVDRSQAMSKRETITSRGKDVGPVMVDRSQGPMSIRSIEGSRSHRGRTKSGEHNRQVSASPSADLQHMNMTLTNSLEHHEQKGVQTSIQASSRKAERAQNPFKRTVDSIDAYRPVQDSITAIPAEHMNMVIINEAHAVREESSAGQLHPASRLGTHRTDNERPESRQQRVGSGLSSIHENPHRNTFGHGSFDVGPQPGNLESSRLDGPHAPNAFA